MGVVSQASSRRTPETARLTGNGMLLMMPALVQAAERVEFYNDDDDGANGGDAGAGGDARPRQRRDYDDYGSTTPQPATNPNFDRKKDGEKDAACSLCTCTLRGAPVFPALAAAPHVHVQHLLPFT